MEKHLEAESPPDRELITVDQNAMTVSHACDFLRQAEIKSCGLLFGASNYVFLATMCMNGAVAKAIYKPRQGEAPLGISPTATCTSGSTQLS